MKHEWFAGNGFKSPRLWVHLESNPEASTHKRPSEEWKRPAQQGGSGEWQPARERILWQT
ncbi:hypothetical protein [Geothrix mesophila]|uniref:hypothetical protein n=1 Tax=Geothrix mesophila TaxID=2922723 RepID=UPI001FAD713D|nr:hypothetical protein [Geothrix sp. SG198]